MINFLHHHNNHCQFYSLNEKLQDILDMHNKRENTHLYSMLFHRHMMSLPILSALSHYFVSFCCSNASGKAHKPESIDIVEQTVGREKSGQLFQVTSITLHLSPCHIQMLDWLHLLIRSRF